VSWAQLEPKYWGADIFENKIEWYFTVITIDYINLKKKSAIFTIFKLEGAKNSIPSPSLRLYTVFKLLNS
jgi:hypothetical protein